MQNKKNHITPYHTKIVEEKWQRIWQEKKINQVKIDQNKPKFYCLDTWAYPSADGVHIGYVKSFGGMDVIARYKRMLGFNVLYPTGWDTLGLPAENYAIKVGKHPREITDESIRHFKEQFQSFGLSYDWSREINTADPSYYRWTQWLFLLMFKNGLAYRAKSKVNWCPQCKTVLAKEQVIENKCERCAAKIDEKELMQWFFKVTAYADKLYQDCQKLYWDQKYLKPHRQWIGKEINENGSTTFHIHDWCVSRQRYWGPPIPIIYCQQCGVVPVPENDLPLKLPYEVDFTPTGESPLAKDSNFVNTRCPQCGDVAKRETDTLDTFVSSSWYQFRFLDPSNQKDFAGPQPLAYWKNVDHYQGTIEHLTAHLIYARFVTKVLNDLGYLNVDEPFPKYTPVGLLVDKHGQKFSKRLGNAPNINQLIDKYGGDLLRLSCYFVSAFDDLTRWGEEDIVAVERLRNRIWRIFTSRVDFKKHQMPQQIVNAMHRMVQDVQENIEQMKFNVALSKVMVFVNSLNQFEGNIDNKMFEVVIKVLAPFAPFITEEMWSIIGHTTSVHNQTWPKVANYVPVEFQEIAVQFNGKFKGTVSAPQNISQTKLVKLLKENEVFNKCIETGIKVIYKKNRIINFVSKK